MIMLDRLSHENSDQCRTREKPTRGCEEAAVSGLRPPILRVQMSEISRFSPGASFSGTSANEPNSASCSGHEITTRY